MLFYFTYSNDKKRLDSLDPFLPHSALYSTPAQHCISASLNICISEYLHFCISLWVKFNFKLKIFNCNIFVLYKFLHPHITSSCLRLIIFSRVEVPRDQEHLPSIVYSLLFTVYTIQYCIHPTVYSIHYQVLYTSYYLQYTLPSTVYTT